MIRKLAVTALALALATPLSTAKAVGTQSYDVCGGTYGSSWSGFAFCASVQVTVVQKAASVWNVAIQIANMSGLNGSYVGSVFTQIGIDNIPGNLANPANITVSQNGQTVCTNKYNDPSPSLGCWTVKQDANATGGFNVDFLDQTSNGLNRDISSLCLNEPTLLYTCLAAHPVTLSFDINANFNPVTQGQIYFHSETILPNYQYAVTECETGASVTARERCSATTFSAGGPVTATPEPATLALMGTGLFAVGGVGLRRRKNAAAPTV
jgi:hypothetical protein